MTRDEIIKMAREAGFSTKHTEVYFDRQIVALFHAAYAAGAAAEREACATVAEEATSAWTEYEFNRGCMYCAKAIRARGET